MDQCVASRLESLSRGAASELVKSGLVLTNGARCKPARRVRAGDEIEVWLSESTEEVPAPEDVQFEVLFEDAGLVVVDKPAGLAVHPGAGRPTGTLVNGLLRRYPEIAAVGGAVRPGIVHRLDMDTSGTLLVARSQSEYLSLIEQFSERRVAKTYLALAEGSVAHLAATIDAPIARSASDRRRMRVDRSGKEALTKLRVVARLKGASLLELDLISGRTHQARVHLAAIGHPIVGDHDYGRSTSKRSPAPSGAARQMLHAWRISASRPDGRVFTCWAGLPSDMEETLTGMGFAAEELRPYRSSGWRREGAD